MARIDKIVCDLCGGNIPSEEYDSNKETHRIAINPSRKPYQDDGDSHFEDIDPDWDDTPCTELLPADEDICRPCFKRIVEDVTEQLQLTREALKAGMASKIVKRKKK